MIVPSLNFIKLTFQAFGLCANDNQQAQLMFEIVNFCQLAICFFEYYDNSNIKVCIVRKNHTQNLGLNLLLQED